MYTYNIYLDGFPLVAVGFGGSPPRFQSFDHLSNARLHEVTCGIQSPFERSNKQLNRMKHNYHLRSAQILLVVQHVVLERGSIVVLDTIRRLIVLT